MGAPALQDWLLARARRRGRPSVAATASGASPAGAHESFPLQIPLGVGHGCARRLGVCASLAARPSPPHARAVAVWCGGARLAREARWGLVRKDDLTRGPH
jgi:hypothetical protein